MVIDGCSIVDIDGYSIGGYWWLLIVTILVAIGGYWWLLCSWLLVDILLVNVSGY